MLGKGSWGWKRLGGVVGFLAGAIPAWWAGAQLSQLQSPWPTSLIWATGAVAITATTTLGVWAAPGRRTPLLEQLRSDPKWVAQQRRYLEEAVIDQIRDRI